jgi:hypothetical protein
MGASKTPTATASLALCMDLRAKIVSPVRPNTIGITKLAKIAAVTTVKSYALVGLGESRDSERPTNVVDGSEG